MEHDEATPTDTVKSCCDFTNQQVQSLYDLPRRLQNKHLRCQGLQQKADLRLRSAKSLHFLVTTMRVDHGRHDRAYHVQLSSSIIVIVMVIIVRHDHRVVWSS